MLVYRVSKRSDYIKNLMEDIGFSPVDILYAMGPLEIYRMPFRHKDLVEMGLRESEISYLLDTGFLAQEEVSRKKAVSIAIKNKIKNEPEYREKVLRALDKARRTLSENPEIGIRTCNIARQRRMKKFRSRRNKLLENVLGPEFGIYKGSIDRSDPVSISKVFSLAMNNRYLSSRYSECRTPYNAVMRDLWALGVKTDRDSEWLSEVQRKVWDEMDPEIREERESLSRKNILDWHKRAKENPSLRKVGSSKSAETRRKMFEEDPDFRERTKENLQKGPSARAKKMKYNAAFREQELKKARTGLAKGKETIVKRKEKRHKYLIEKIIVPEFGSPHWVSLGFLKEVVENTPKGKKYIGMFPRTNDVHPRLKKDLSEIRKQYPIDFEFS